jgi:hypothetical protein
VKQECTDRKKLVVWFRNLRQVDGSVEILVDWIAFFQPDDRLTGIGRSKTDPSDQR